MKFVLSLTILGFLVLSCKKTENSITPTSDSTTIIMDDSMTTVAPMPNDTTRMADTTAAGNATRTNTIDRDSTQITK